METVKVKKEVLDNIHTFYHESKDWFGGMLKRGANFVYIREDGEDRFCPSRFAGYKNNSASNHEVNWIRDGRETDVALQKIAKDNGLCQMNKLGKEEDEKPTSNWEQLELRFRRLCESYDIVPNNKRRGYWDWS